MKKRDTSISYFYLLTEEKLKMGIMKGRKLAAQNNFCGPLYEEVRSFYLNSFICLFMLYKLLLQKWPPEMNSIMIRKQHATNLCSIAVVNVVDAKELGVRVFVVGVLIHTKKSIKDMLDSKRGSENTSKLLSLVFTM